MLSFLQANIGSIVAILSAIIIFDHALASDPKIAASSTYQAITNVLDKIKLLLGGAAPKA